MKKYKFLILGFLTLSILTGCNRNNTTNVNVTGDNDGADVDVSVNINIGNTIEDEHKKVYVFSGGSYVENLINNNSETITNTEIETNNDLKTDENPTTTAATTTTSETSTILETTTTTQISTTTTQTTTTKDTTIVTATTTQSTTQQDTKIKNNTTITNKDDEKTLLNDDVELIIHSANSCTGHISNDYITKYYIGRKSGDFKTIGWSIYMQTNTDNMSIATELDWDNEESGDLRAVGIYQDEGTIQNGIDFRITDDGLFIELNSNNLPFDLYEVNYIEIRNISEIV